MINTQTIPCPVCKSPIIFDPKLLIQGKKFSCGACGGAVGIAQESLEQVKNASHHYEALLTQSGSQKKKHTHGV